MKFSVAVSKYREHPLRSSEYCVTMTNLETKEREVTFKSLSQLEAYRGALYLSNALDSEKEKTWEDHKDTRISLEVV